MLMNRGSFNYLTLYFLLGFLLILAPSANLYAQDEDDSVEEIFWGDEEGDEGLDEEFDFSDDGFFEQIAELGKKYATNSQLKDVNGNRGSKHFIYMNRTFFGLYNLMHDIGARNIKINTFTN